MHTPAPLLCPESALASFDLVSFGKILVPSHPLRFGFQVDLVPSQHSCTQVVFALLSHDPEVPAPEDKPQGFAVRVDLKTGEVWDLLNESGLVGWIDKPAETFTDEEPLLFNWEVEHYGAALIPKLQIANEVFLYPALRHTPGMVMTTAVGSESGHDSLHSFIHPAVWKESF